MGENAVKHTFKSCERFKDAPPEGGWGFVVMLGLAFSFTLTLGVLPCFALLFGDFIKSLGKETSAITLITSCYFMSFSIVGLFANILFKKFSPLAVARAGGLVFLIGSFLTIAVTNVWQLVISYGIMQGAGFGVMMSVSFTLFNRYFVKKRIMMMSLTQGLIGIGSMLMPIMIERVMQYYGFRGCLVILAALNGHALLGMMVMHPVEWHMRKVEISDYELCERDDATQEVIEKPDDINLNQRLLSPDGSYHSSTSLSSLNDFQVALKRNSSMVSLGIYSTGMPVDVAVAAADEKDEPKGIWIAIVNFLDLTLLKDAIYVNIALGMSFALYSDVMFFTIQPLYLFQLGFTKADTAQIIAIGAGSDLLSRFFLGVISGCISVTARNIYLAGAIFSIVARFGFLYVNDFLGMAIITGVMGFFRAWLHVPIALVLGEYLPTERFPSGNGLFMFMEGVITFIVGPLLGWIRDYTNSYVLTFHCLAFSMGLCAVPWLIETLWLKCRRNGEENVNNVRNHK